MELAVTVTTVMFTMRSGWGAGFEFWGTGLSLRNPLFVVGFRAGHLPEGGEPQ